MVPLKKNAMSGTDNFFFLFIFFFILSILYFPSIYLPFLQEVGTFLFKACCSRPYFRTGPSTRNYGPQFQSNEVSTFWRLESHGIKKSNSPCNARMVTSKLDTLVRKEVETSELVNAFPFRNKSRSILTLIIITQHRLLYQPNIDVGI